MLHNLKLSFSIIESLKYLFVLKTQFGEPLLEGLIFNFINLKKGTLKKFTDVKFFKPSFENVNNFT